MFNTKNKNSLKKISVWLIFLLVFAILLGWCIRLWNRWEYNLNAYEAEEFQNHREEFTILAKEFLDRFEFEFKNNANLSYIRVCPIGTKLQVIYFDISEKNVSFTEEMSENTKAYLSLMQSVLSGKEKGYGNFTSISINKNQVAIETDGPYALVYSPKERPTFISYPDERFSYFVDRVFFDWYQVVERLEIADSMES